MPKAVISEVRGHEKYERLVEGQNVCRPLRRPLLIPVTEQTSLRGAIEAAEAGLIVPESSSGLRIKLSALLNPSPSTSKASKLSMFRTVTRQLKRRSSSCERARPNS